MEGEAESGALETGKEQKECEPAGSCPGSSFRFWSLVRLCCISCPEFCVIGHSFSDQHSLGTGPHTAANEIDYDLACVAIELANR